MNAVHRLVTDHIELWTGAENEKKSGRGRAAGSAVTVYGIKKLRELILELAVRGKLVPQDASDEPASELIKRIQVSKEQLSDEGRTRKNKSPNAITDDEIPFSLPSGWAWTRFGDIVNICTGRLDANAAVDMGEYPFFTCSQTPSKIDSYSFDTSAVLLAGNGDFNVKYYQGKFDAYQRTYVIEPIDFSLKFCFLLVLAQIKTITKNNRGSAIPYLKVGDLTTPVFALPPSHEQLRIVAKVDELMALCDQLEAGHSDAIEAHEKLVSHLLSTLVGSQDSADFTASWQRIAANFDMLFTTEASIDALKQTLLQLAVMGKLVPQDRSDESASALLERIQAEKARLVLDGKNKEDKPLAAISADAQPFDLPHGWEWVRLQNLLDSSRQISYGVIKLGNEPKTGGVYTLRCSDVKSGFIDLSYVRRVSEEIEIDYIRTRLNGGEILLNIRGTLGGVALVDPILKGYNIAREIAVIPISPLLSGVFLVNVMQSGYFWNAILDGLRGIAYQGLNLGLLRLFAIPLPPISEQHRIVAKVDELMALCDRMKERIADAGALQRKLADVMVAQAVA